MKLFTLDTDTTKRIIYARLKISKPGPGYCYFPAEYEPEYFQQFCDPKIRELYTVLAKINIAFG